MTSVGATEEQILANIQAHQHWPLEGFLTPQALQHIKWAVRRHLHTEMPQSVHIELANLANNIDSHLQHLIAEAKVVTQPTGERVRLAMYGDPWSEPAAAPTCEPATAQVESEDHLDLIG